MRTGRLSCRAVLAVLLPAAAARAQSNLLVNGDFESGTPTGWTAWAAPWSVNNPPDFFAAEPGCRGNRCLRLSTPSEGSFGVYQQVAVEPGKSYRLDAWWKGRYLGQKNWYELLLIDGPFSLDAADNPNVDQINKIYAYDTPNNPLTADFGWEWGHTLDGTAADWNGFQGIRTAGGTVMTVVLKAGACCGAAGAEGWFDDVSLVEVDPPPPLWGCTLQNGGFDSGLTGWQPWIVRNDNADASITAADGELRIAGSSFDAGVWQQIPVAVPGTVISVTGRWRTESAVPGATWAEVWVINESRVPVNGVTETDGLRHALLLYRSDTAGGRGPWDGPIPRTAPVVYRASFVAEARKVTLILRAGSTAAAPASAVRFDDLQVHGVPPAMTPDAPAAGFQTRTFVFPVSNMVSLAQSPVSGALYAISNEPVAAATRLYRVNVDGPAITATPVSGPAGLVAYAQGLAFDPYGHMYISTQYGQIFKGVDTDPDPGTDAFVFGAILTMPPLQLGTFHGVGGLAVGPDDRLYINSGSESHYGYLSGGQPEVFEGRLNARILRCGLDGSALEVFCEGLRNSFDIAFRLDGRLFGVENGPNTGCDYAEEFNLLEGGRHYGFPYHYGSDLSGGDASIACTGTGMPGPPPLPGGLTTTPAWANYGPDAVPPPGGTGYADGGVYFGFNPHSSPDGLSFYEPQRMDPGAVTFPPAFHDRAFVARFGNLEAVPDVGFDVLSLGLDEAGEGFVCNRFLTGLGRAVDVLCARNGRLYVLEYNQQATFGGPGWGSPGRLHEIRYTVSVQPTIELSPTSLVRSVQAGLSPSPDTVLVTNRGGATLFFTAASDRPWAIPSPAGGTAVAPSETAVLTIAYDAGHLPVGGHSAVISVSDPAALGSPRQLGITLTVRSVRPDLDQDRDVDQADFGHLQRCLDMTSFTPPAECVPADLNGDGWVDNSDLPPFLECLSGPNITANPACDDAYGP